MPKPPLVVGRDAWLHWLSLKENPVTPSRQTRRARDALDTSAVNPVQSAARKT